MTRKWTWMVLMALMLAAPAASAQETDTIASVAGAAETTEAPAPITLEETTPDEAPIAEARVVDNPEGEPKAGSKKAVAKEKAAAFGWELLANLMYIFGALLLAFASWGMKILTRKWKLDLDLSQDAAIRAALRGLIGGAQEWAARKMKVDPEGAQVSGLEKAAWVKGQMNGLWPGLMPVTLDRLLDEELAKLPGVGATGDDTPGRLDR